jgi:N-methylhydantoinase A
VREREVHERLPESDRTAEAYFKETGLRTVAVYDGPALSAGTRIEGPGIVREPTTTLVVYPGSSAVVTPLGNYVLEIGPGTAETAPLEEALAP